MYWDEQALKAFGRCPLGRIDVLGPAIRVLNNGDVASGLPLLTEGVISQTRVSVERRYECALAISTKHLSLQNKARTRSDGRNVSEGRSVRLCTGSRLNTKPRLSSSSHLRSALNIQFSFSSFHACG